MIASLAQNLAGQVVNSAVEAVILVGFVWLLLKVTRQNARTRFVIWFVTLVAVVALPVVAHHGSTRAFSRLSEVSLPSVWAEYLLAGWVIGVALAMVRLAAGVWRVVQLRRSAEEVDSARLAPTIARLLQEQASSRPVALCVSDAVNVPMAVGFIRPAVIFPAGLLQQLSAEELEVILLHELAHLRRWDDWTNLAQKLVKALLFFHPAVWWVERRLTLEREMACDDLVLTKTESARRYASLLLSFSEKMQNARALSMVQGLIGRVCQISVRVAGILDAQATSRGALRKPVLAVGAAVMAATFAATPHLPRLVTFRAQAESAAVDPVMPGNKLEFNHAAAEISAPRMIPAAYHPKDADAVPAKKKPSVPKAKVTRTAAAREKVLVPSRTESHAPVMLVVFHDVDLNISHAVIWSVYVVQVPADGEIPAGFVLKI